MEGHDTEDSFGDWRWQMRKMAGQPDGNWFPPVGLTPYYAKLVEQHPVLRALVEPNKLEHQVREGELMDPLGEDEHRPVPNIVHTYPDKVLFLVTAQCAGYCRFCTRARSVGRENWSRGADWNVALDYIRGTPAVRDVLITGGDPLVLSDHRLEDLLRSLYAIPHVEFVRIGTRVRAVLPQRITEGLCQALRRYGRPWLGVHFAHPAEITPESEQACTRLLDAGLPLGNQHVLLRGVNDDATVLKQMNHELLRIGVRPYYIHHCDAIAGKGHFRVPLNEALSLMQDWHGHTTGYAVPMLAVDTPGGGGKTIISTESSLVQHGARWQVKTWTGEVRTIQE